jgi:hypothetical protein
MALELIKAKKEYEYSLTLTDEEWEERYFGKTGLTFDCLPKQGYLLELHFWGIDFNLADKFKPDTDCSDCAMYTEEEDDWYICSDTQWELLEAWYEHLDKATEEKILDHAIREEN